MGGREKFLIFASESLTAKGLDDKLSLMPENIIETFDVKHIQVLNEKGEADAALMPEIPDETIKKMYETLVFSRVFDQRALNLQREGRIGTYASVHGQEASQVGSAFALEKTDWVFPSFREMAVYIAMGYPPYMLFQFWAGDERGMKTPDDLNIFPLCIPVGTQAPHAVGAAMAMKIKKMDSIAAVYFGDGGTSKGDFHEGLNFAGVYKLPVVFICQNNQWAISVPRSRQTASLTLAQKAISYGFEGIQVDGNDIFGVYKATSDAVKKARDGRGPTLIECFTYRVSDHTTADDASRYRSKEEVEEWLKKDPILRLKTYMDGKGLWSEGYQKKVEASAKSKVDEAVKKAEDVPPPLPEDILKYTYKEMTLRQKKELKESGWL
jgi:pyruvate dehydrogenase E1 component alpha subunit